VKRAKEFIDKLRKVYKLYVIVILTKCDEYLKQFENNPTMQKAYLN
jgi:hypothetical protein